MEEQIVTFETAKLARECGFNEGSYQLYTWPNNELKRFQSLNYNIEQDELQYEAPTQSLLQKWLREKHKIDIWMFGTNGFYYVGIKSSNRELAKYFYPESREYEYVLELSLQEALKLIE